MFIIDSALIWMTFGQNNKFIEIYQLQAHLTLQEWSSYKTYYSHLEQS